ncbi:MAG: N,N-dimethylformamidase beta subunit family domain-containing protein [Acidimicrobiales bacterium]
MIQAYPDRLSVAPGETLTLHLATDRPELRVAIYRQGIDLTLQHDYGWQPTRTLGIADGPPDAAWEWDGYDFVIDPDAPSGAYIAMLWERDGADVVEPDGGVTTSVGTFGKALFVVRSAHPGVDAPILYRLPIATYHAYNFSGEASLYLGSPGRVTMHRPGGGTGGTVSDFTEPGLGDFDELDQQSSRQTFEHYDAKFIRWLEGAGQRVDYCADTDVHLDGDLELLSPYGLVLSVGHDEYWSAETRANLAAYVAQGGNLAFFGANTCWWRIRYDDDLTGFASNRDGTVTRVDSDQWWVAARYDPGASAEDALTGVSYRNAGGWWWPGRPPTGFEVQQPDHWVFEAGVDPQFGEPESLVGYECDGVELTAASALPGQPAIPTFADGTPAGFTVLAVGRLAGQWAFENRDPDSPTASAAPRAATMGVYAASGTVFNAAVVDWARVLEAGEPNVERITRTVLARLGGVAVTSRSLTPAPGLVALDAFATDAAAASPCAAVVATDDGSIRAQSFGSAGPTADQPLAQMTGLLDVAAFVSEDDRAHVIVAQDDGTVTDLSFPLPLTVPPAAPPVVTSRDLGGHPGVVAVSGFFSDDDGFSHAIVLQDDGTLTEIFFHPVLGQDEVALGTFPGAIDVASFFSADDGYRHAIVLQDDGTLTEVFFHPVQGRGTAELATIAGGRRVSGHRVDDDAHFDRRIVVTADDGRLHEVRFAAHAPIVRSVIANLTPPSDDVASFSAGDGRRQAVLGRSDGSIELRSYEP